MLNVLSDALVLIALTVPLAATVGLEAPVELWVILPLTVPPVAPVRRTSIVVAETVPLVGDSVTVPEYALLPLRISNPVGAVIVISVVKFVPDTV